MAQVLDGSGAAEKHTVPPHPLYWQLHIHIPERNGELKLLGGALPPERRRDAPAMPSACGSGTSGADCRTFTGGSLKAMENSIQGEIREIAFFNNRAGVFTHLFHPSLNATESSYLYELASSASLSHFSES